MEPRVISATARFANFELQLQTGELRKNGEILRLPPQPAKILSYLVSHSGQLVTREELHRQLWSEGTFVDFDQGLNFCIRQIRTVLNDDAESPQFIETVPRRGYRFRATVEMSGNSSKHFSQAAGEATVPVTPTNWSQRKSDRWRNSTQVLLAGVAILLAVIVLLGLGYFRRERNWSTASERRLTANPIEAPVDSATISPDGKYLAYTDKTGVYLRQVDVGEIHRLPLLATFKLAPSSWFPDSSHFALDIERVAGTSAHNLENFHSGRQSRIPGRGRLVSRGFARWVACGFPAQRSQRPRDDGPGDLADEIRRDRIAFSHQGPGGRLAGRNHLGAKRPAVGLHRRKIETGRCPIGAGDGQC